VIQMSNKIISAKITVMPKSIFDEMPKVIATFKDGTVKELFSFYPDEISFNESEFVGLTEQEASSLKQKKDLHFLQN
jgi:hypothetical protein